MTPLASDWNRQVIDEFRANGGKVAQFQHQPLLLLHHKGAKTGTERVNPLAYQAVGDDFAVFGSKAGAPTNPDWFHNLLANPDTVVEVGTETIPVHARVAEGEERDRIWEEQKRRNEGFAAYEEKTTRSIPVVVLERAAS
ncbi:MAG TPA: nitroreductase family deazaflavin-dependent oxidoreductase [Gaiellaceae bacterium]|nr:nitroreductase family deazaflavin-dependent oxidoreductase [Gaiellaceae bacterium]